MSRRLARRQRTFISDGTNSLGVNTAAVFVLGLLLLVAPLASGSPAALERPSWTPGDTWTYTSNTTLLPGLNLTGTGTSTVRGRVSVMVGGSTVDAYDVLVTASGTAAGLVSNSSGTFTLAGQWILTGEERFDPVSLQLLYDLYELDVNGSANVVFPFTARVQNTTTYEIRTNDWQYPLAAGTSGALAIGYNFTRDFYSSLYPHIHQEGVGQWNLTFSVAAPTTVAAPAGSFEAFPITETWPDGSVDRVFAAPQVGNNARSESYDAQGNLTAVSTLRSYRYQALEESTFLGLTLLGWAVVGTVLAVAVIVVFVARRTRRKKQKAEPPGPDLTSGPRGP